MVEYLPSMHKGQGSGFSSQCPKQTKIKHKRRDGEEGKEKRKEGGERGGGGKGKEGRECGDILFVF